MSECCTGIRLPSTHLLSSDDPSEGTPRRGETEDEEARKEDDELASYFSLRVGGTKRASDDLTGELEDGPG